MESRPILKRPKILTICALIYAIAPFLNIFLLSNMIHQPLWGADGFMKNIHPMLLVPLLANPIVAFGIYSTRLWGWVTFVAYSVFLIGSHSLVVMGASYPWYSVAPILILTGFTMMILFQAGVRAPFFNPKVRLWEQAARFRAPIDVRVYCGDLIMDANTMDVSSTGCFIRVEMSEEDIGAPVMITLDRRRNPVHAIGEIVRVSQDPSSLGVGVRFLSIDPKSHDNLSGLLVQLREKIPSEKEAPAAKAETKQKPARKAG